MTVVSLPRTQPQTDAKGAFAALKTYDSAASWRPGNNFGGNTVFKALTHPLVIEPAAKLLAALRGKKVAVYDPEGHFAAFSALFPLRDADVVAYYVQNVTEQGKKSPEGLSAKLIVELDPTAAEVILIASFNAEKTTAQVLPYLLDKQLPVLTLAALALPSDMLTRPKNLLDPLNYCVNNVLFQHTETTETALATANYWGEYGAAAPRLWLCLYNKDGTIAGAGWWKDLPAAGGGLNLSSRDVCAHFGLQHFDGTLFIHLVGGAGHDLIKYGLDFFKADGSLTATHDANPWPADVYAGIPAPRVDEAVTLHLQSVLPLETPADTIGLRLMGTDETVWLNEVLPAFATRDVSLRALFPDAVWPQQVELIAHKALTRPRYTVQRAAKQWIGHANVERADLKPDAALAGLEPVFGKGFILPLPVLPMADFDMEILPTPMSTAQDELALKLYVYDASGVEASVISLGRFKRGAIPAFSLRALLAERGVDLPSSFGSVQLAYDFSTSVLADGWLHAIARYTHVKSGAVAETSFGAHIFNSSAVYKNEPQSYSSSAPGLTTRLFMRLSPKARSVACLMYPVSKAWRPASDTVFVLRGSAGETVAEVCHAIPANGAVMVYADTLFDAATMAKAGADGYISVRDTTCRLFGYAGLLRDSGAFSLDHMFGF